MRAYKGEGSFPAECNKALIMQFMQGWNWQDYHSCPTWYLQEVIFPMRGAMVRAEEELSQEREGLRRGATMPAAETQEDVIRIIEAKRARAEAEDRMWNDGV